MAFFGLDSVLFFYFSVFSLSGHGQCEEAWHWVPVLLYYQLCLGQLFHEGHRCLHLRTMQTRPVHKAERCWKMSVVTACNLLSPAPGPRCSLSPPSAPAPRLTEKSTSCPLSASSSTPSSVTHSPRPACLEAWLTVSVALCFSSCLSQGVTPPRPLQSPRPSWAYCIYTTTACPGKQQGTSIPPHPTPKTHTHSHALHQKVPPFKTNAIPVGLSCRACYDALCVTATVRSMCFSLMWRNLRIPEQQRESSQQLLLSLQWLPWWALTSPWTLTWVHWAPHMHCSNSYPWCLPPTVPPLLHTPWTAASPGTSLNHSGKTSTLTSFIFPFHFENGSSSIQMYGGPSVKYQILNKTL